MVRGFSARACTPEAKQRLLGDITGLLVAEAQATDEAPELLAVQRVDGFHDRSGGGSRTIVFVHGRFVRHCRHVSQTFHWVEALRSTARRGQDLSRETVRFTSPFMRGLPKGRA
jgi:hypothetical protein